KHAHTGHSYTHTMPARPPARSHTHTHCPLSHTHTHTLLALSDIILAAHQTDTDSSPPLHGQIQTPWLILLGELWSLAAADHRVDLTVMLWVVFTSLPVSHIRCK